MHGEFLSGYKRISAVIARANCNQYVWIRCVFGEQRKCCISNRFASALHQGSSGKIGEGCLLYRSYLSDGV
jgi:hypothetical protein